MTGAGGFIGHHYMKYLVSEGSQGCSGLDGGEIEVWGAGEQTRSFIYVDDCV